MHWIYWIDRELIIDQSGLYLDSGVSQRRSAMWKLNIQSIKAHSIQKCCGVSLDTSASVMKEAIKRK